jgi:hypothetical protein
MWLHVHDKVMQAHEIQHGEVYMIYGMHLGNQDNAKDSRCSKSEWKG